MKVLFIMMKPKVHKERINGVFTNYILGTHRTQAHFLISINQRLEVTWEEVKLYTDNGKQETTNIKCIALL